ncbi:hypothetical protein A2881_05700 [Candidatus Peribacteria bacterium RIFCSPHIGHO2_01_FULL_55_13]|nr:MAG: hypothetical protein A2881_05700 [Candidatus Peribacteria bacterium RIFCSPHIGHO2_01_FULL_55_13]OGJ65665.1 MAG: hypothetical protein A3F36_04330 [Candidatus Peribacteria bacterium RIFCSPHIGHO2_12_FULL_55_11]
MKYALRPSKRFKSGYDLSLLGSVIDQLAHGNKLDVRYRDHELKGKLKGTRECHIGPDWLLRYAKDEEYLFLLLVSTGSHRRVLGIE